MHYVDCGPQSKPPASAATGCPEHGTLLFVHGNPTWSFLWRRLIKHFSATHRCVAIDHIGCGLSDKPQDYPYTLAQHIANLRALVEALDLRNITLVVHDWGGAIGTGMAGQVPERIARIVACNTAAFPSDLMPASIALCRIPGFGALAIRGLNAFVRGALATCAQKPLRRQVRAGYLAPYGSWRSRVANLRFVQDIPMDASHPSFQTLVQVEAGLARLRSKPVLLCWGGRDYVFTEEFLQEWVKRFPHAWERWYPDAGHFVTEDAHEQITQAMEEFLRATPLAAEATTAAMGAEMAVRP
ncbi:MAG: alpha/beta fold hydrolase [Planctomycetes bacterium]|nr:alpha/beta fold hydrolase [Planctomycetota bacterium]